MPNLTVALRRRFGVEIECGIEGQSYTSVLQKLLSEKNGFSRGWYGKTDGSGLEVCTPILQGREGFDELRRAYKALHEAGAYTTIADGMHVHLEAKEFVKQPERCAALLESWVDNQEAIYQMVAPWRRNSTMCLPWSKAMVQRLRERGAFDGGYHDLTFKLFKPTIEVRLHEGTLDYEVAEAWIRFMMRFVDRALKRPVKPMGEGACDALLKTLRTPQKQREKIAQKIAAQHANDRQRGGFKHKADGYAHEHRDGIKGGL